MKDFYEHFYEFEHECDAMPDGTRFCKINGTSQSQFTVESMECDANQHVAFMNSTTIYGFKFCPYCGQKVADR